MATSQKYRDFMSGPIGEKSISVLPGVGEELRQRLEKVGIDKAYLMLGKYLVLKKDRVLFLEWMKEICNANSQEASDCYQCLKDWCDEFM